MLTFDGDELMLGGKSPPKNIPFAAPRSDFPRRLPTPACTPAQGLGGAEDLQPFALACHLDLLWWACRHAAGWALQSASLQLQREPCSPFLLALWHLE